MSENDSGLFESIRDRAGDLGDRARSTARRADRTLASAQLRADDARERVDSARETAGRVESAVGSGFDSAFGEPPSGGSGDILDALDDPMAGGAPATEPLDPVAGLDDPGAIGGGRGSLDPVDDVAEPIDTGRQSRSPAPLDPLDGDDAAFDIDGFDPLDGGRR